MRISDWSSDVCSSDLVIALILQRIGAQLVDEPDPAALLPQIEQHVPSRVGHRMERGVELRPALAFEYAEQVAGQAFAVKAQDGGVLFAPVECSTDLMPGRYGGVEGNVAEAGVS